MEERRARARRPTMKDIARRAGVSESAVSFALNDRPGVSEATRERVRRVAEHLGWRPSTAARALSGEGAATVGLILARPAATLGVESFFLQLVSGVQQVLAERQLGLLFQVVEDVEAECATYRRWWAEHRVDGVLVVDPRTTDPRPGLLDSLGLPTVVIGGTVDEGAADAMGVVNATGTADVTDATGAADATDATDATEGARAAYPTMSTVWADDAGGMALIAGHLHALGHRRVAHIAGLPNLAHTARRVRSLRAEAARLGFTEARSVPTDYSDAEGAAATRRVLAEPDPPTAIVYDNDVMAAAGAAVITAAGLSVPGDVSVVSWEDSVLCRVVHPWLTALGRDTIAFGRTAAEELTALLDGGAARVARVPPPELIVRESTAPPPGR
ncbi:LacI family DNA-binding transcriptional regulator [Streptantibioticus parmotrematis]|nr:LacI family DNA-binding transcriptional regulator [Streptantibioticus parmotrematis]